MRATRRAKQVVLGAVAMGMVTLACGGKASDTAVKAPPPEVVPETCATRLAPRTLGHALPAASPLKFVAPRSTVVVGAEIPLAGLRAALESKVPRRVAEERDHDLGRAGRLEYTVDRGPFTVRVEGDALVVEAMLQGRAQACAKGRCYAGCAPEAKVTAKVPLRLSKDYKLRSSDVHIDVTRGCEVKALGGFLTIDVTPILRGALAQQSRSVQASIDRELPDLRPDAARLWTELGKPRALPLGMCVVLAPEEITQGAASGTAELARLRFGVLARPEVRVKCETAGDAPQPGGPRLLPPLRDDLALPAAGDVHLAIVLPSDAPARGLERSGDVLDFGGRRARTKQVSGDVTSGLMVDLGGEVCGDVAISVGGVVWNDGQSLHLTGTAPMPGEAERLRDVDLDVSPIVKSAERSAIAVPIAVGSLGTVLPELARAMSDDHLTVSAVVEGSRPESAGLRGSDVIAVALVRGAVTLRAK